MLSHCRHKVYEPGKWVMPEKKLDLTRSLLKPVKKLRSVSRPSNTEHEFPVPKSTGAAYVPDFLQDFVFEPGTSLLPSLEE